MANEQGTNDNPITKRPRGFAAISPELRSAIARKGGIAAHQAGTAHEWDHEEASLAGQKGGRNHAAKKAAARLRAEDATGSGD